MASPTQCTWVWVNSGVGDGQGALACCGLWGRKESDTTEWLYWMELMKQKQTHKFIEQICGCQRKVGRGKNWGFGTSRCKLLYVWCINNRVLLYSSGNYIQYPVVNQNGNKYKEECIHTHIHRYIFCIYFCIYFLLYKFYIYITKSICCTGETDKTL